MDLDNDELKETRKHNKRKYYKFYNTDYQEIQKLKKLYNVDFDFKIFEIKEDKDNENS